MTREEEVFYEDAVDDFRDPRCFDADEHVAISTATVNLGRGRWITFTELCIFCNVKIRTWREYDDAFTF